ncbi:MAG: hypothetical protein IJ680_05820 [Paludibacteraceae bacterium]|nr:hypothetical protein [Paludibacteraceae bacterium]
MNSILIVNAFTFGTHAIVVDQCRLFDNRVMLFQVSKNLLICHRGVVVAPSTLEFTYSIVHFKLEHIVPEEWLVL